MIRKLLILALGLLAGGMAYAAARTAEAAPTQARKPSHRTHAKSRSPHATRHGAHARSRSGRKHTARASHAAKAAPRTGKATHRA